VKHWRNEPTLIRPWRLSRNEMFSIDCGPGDEFQGNCHMKNTDTEKSCFDSVALIAQIALAILLFAIPCAAGSGEALIKAATQGDADSLKLQLKDGADVNAKRPHEGSTALMEASKEGYAHVVDFLLKHGADVNAGNINGWTALMAATTNGHTETVKLLLEHGADVNARHAYGWTALKLASQKNHDHIKKLLLKHGAKK